MQWGLKKKMGAAPRCKVPLGSNLDALKICRAVGLKRSLGTRERNPREGSTLPRTVMLKTDPEGPLSRTVRGYVAHAAKVVILAAFKPYCMGEPRRLRNQSIASCSAA